MNEEELAKLDSLLKRQQELGSEVESLIKNFKKDGPARKTKEYYSKKFEQLKELADEFTANDEWLQKIEEQRKVSNYFGKNYVGHIVNLLNQYMELFKKGTEENGESSGQQQRGGSNSQQQQGNETTVTPIDKLIRRQNVMISSLKRLLQADVPEDATAPSLKAKEKLWEQIQELHFSIWEDNNNPMEVGYNMEAYMDVETNIMQALAKSNTTLAPAPNASSPQIQLPKINIPKFDGEYGKWPTFKDLFEKVVHSQKISAVQKMWYLKTNLIGEAERLIRHLSLTDNNYDTAWTILKDRFSNKRVLTATLIQQMLDIPNVASDAKAIKDFHDIVQENLAAISNMEVDTTNWDPLLLQLLVKKLDRHTHGLYEASIKNPRELQSIKNFLKFLEQRFQALESMGSKEKPKQDKNNTHKEKNKATASIVSSSLCKVCNGKEHPLYTCEKFKNNMTPAERLNWVQKQRLCVNCFKSTHKARDCKSRACPKCNLKHNSLLHLEKRNEQPESKALSVPSTGTQMTNESSPVAVTTASSTKNQAIKTQNYVLLATAKVRITANNGQTCEARALLDAGSQVNLVSQKLVNKLSLSTTKSQLSIEGVGLKTGSSKARVNIGLAAHDGEFSTRMEAFVIPQIISNQPSRDLNIKNWQIPTDISLADPEFFKSEKIDVLIGAEFYHSLLRPEQIEIGSNRPLLQNTSLGWIVIGKTETESTVSATCAVFTDEEARMSEILERFWKLDDFTEERTFMTKAETLCENHFVQNVTTNEQGRFVVRLPFSEEPSTLGESRNIAKKRFEALERRLERQPSIKQEYIKFMQEYERLGHMEKIQEQDIPATNYFIPHHYVLKPDSTTTKLRVVFDASTKTSNGRSLNDILFRGPTVQSELVSILLRFRTHRFVFTADVEKMYRQILVHDDDTMQQLIIWRNNTSANFEYYRLKTVTYGTTAAPYLATKCLQHLANLNMSKYTYGAPTVRDDFYVDDCLSGANEISSALETQRQITSLLQEAGFKLRKWCANHPRLLAGIPSEDQEIDLDFDNGSNQTIKTLGLIWLPKTDELCGRATITETNKITKRSVSSDVARIFDPLGIFGPITVTAKIFMQKLWQLKLSWDEEVPAAMVQYWTHFRNDLLKLNNLRTYRHVFNAQTPLTIQIHTFVDASSQAYGAAVYLRATYKDKTVTNRLLCAKSKVAPIKSLTIPRLELSAAVVGAELTHRVKRDLNYTNVPTFYWSDSQIVLSWIHSPSSTLHTFVANRITKIHQLSSSDQWHHVASKDNPADTLSRGVHPDKLSSCSQWFFGPFFLYGSNEWWRNPEAKIEEVPNDIERKTKSVVAITRQWDPLETIIYQIEHKNSFRFLLHTVGYMLRPFQRPRPKQLSLSPAELRTALLKIIKTIQTSEFHDDIQNLIKYKAVKGSSSLSKLTPFIDAEGILRVGGRLEASELPPDAKHPMLIPYNVPISKLIFKMKHEEQMHCGPTALLAAVKQTFWPIKGKNMARSTVHKCVTCSKAKPKFFKQLMGPLPADRVRQARPFQNTGVDYCGPFWIHYKVRGKQATKAYLAVFCCFATKAVHLELVSDLTTDGFIGALRRFVSTRGRCKNLYCDNATNFVGARNQLNELRETIHSKGAQDIITRYSSDQGIDFKFIPPRAPHFGGLWEAAVKSAKHLLRKNIANASLTYEELETIIKEAEAILNSRPLTPLSADPNDLTPLTPGHFLIGEPLTAPPDPNLPHQNMGLLTRWRLVSHLKHQFWKQWSREYLNELQQRNKWKTESRNLAEDTMVIIKDENLHIMKWPIGRVLKTHKGNDGLVRSAEIKTANGIYTRPIHLLAPLPTVPDTDDTSQESNTEADNAENISTTRNPNPDDRAATAPSLVVSIPLNRIRNSKNLFPEVIPKKISRDQDDDTTFRRTTSEGRNRMHSTLLITLLALMLIPVITCAPIIQQRFPDKPGLYFEGVGTLNRIVGDWKIITYFDLAPIRNEIELFKNGTAALHDLCTVLTQKDMCNALFKKFNEINFELQTNERLLKRRKTRGAIDVVGNIANKLFGVLDSEYAENMSQTINELKANDGILLKLIKNQTSVVDSTINIISKETEAITLKINQFQMEISNTTQQLFDLSNHVDLLEMYTSISAQLSLMAANLQSLESAVFDTITDAKNGKISPLLISPLQIEQEITKIKSYLPSSLHLPFDQEDIAHLYSVMSSKSGITADHILFILTIPLTNHEVFSLFQITPIPAVVNDTMISIQPETTYFAVSPHRDQYFAMSHNDLQSCIHAKQLTNQLLCSGKPLKYHQGASELMCEFSLLRNKTDENCTYVAVNSDTVWSPLHTSNEWIFASKYRTQLAVVCNDNTDLIELQGSHLIKLQDDCTIKHNIVTIQAHKSYTTTRYESLATFGQFGTAYKPDVRLISNNSRLDFSQELQQLKQLQQGIEQANIMELPNKVYNDNIHQYMISYLALLLVIGSIPWLLWKFKQMKQGFILQQDGLPTPQPRFTVDLELANK